MTYHEDGCFVGASISVLDSGVFAAFDFGQFDVDLAGCPHAEQRTLQKRKDRCQKSPKGKNMIEYSGVYRVSCLFDLLTLFFDFLN